MLETLYVKNVALIDETTIDFKQKLNIMTGETGAGKSILIGSIQLALGAKSGKSVIRTGAEYAYVELTFRVTTKAQIAKLNELDVFLQEDGGLILQRRILPQKSICKINGETVSGKTLQEVGEILLDLHGQQEHQSLRNKSKHAQILDNYAKDELAKELDISSKLYEDYKEIKSLLESEKETGKNKQKEMDFLQFEKTEIEHANLEIGEDQTLENTFNRMTNGKKLTGALYSTYQYLSDDYKESASAYLGRGIKELSQIRGNDRVIDEMNERLLLVEEQLNDLCNEISKNLQDLEFDEKDYDEISGRLDLLNRLKSKYGNSIEEVLAYYEDCCKKIEKYEHFEEYIIKLEHDLKELEKAYFDQCIKLSRIRKKYAQKLEQELEAALLELNFTEVNFKIVILEGDAYAGKRGFNDIEFQISLNRGEVLKPLQLVASGGELSRIMLAIKTVLSDQDETQTLIFDEIDAGISGKTAWKVAQKLGILGQEHQVICITHLPQIAAMADVHYVIEKTFEENSTKTGIRELSDGGEVEELARLLGAGSITEAVLENARELKEQAAMIKGGKGHV